MKKKITVMPIEKWLVARIIKFRFKYHTTDCDGTIVYTRPLTDTYNGTTKDPIDQYIIDAISFSFLDIKTNSTQILIDNDFENLKQVYDGGRPSISFNIRMTPNLDVNTYNSLVDCDIYTYDFKFNLYLDYAGSDKVNDILTVHSFACEHDNLLNDNVNKVKSL